MNTNAHAAFLSGALALTIACACGAAYGAEAYAAHPGVYGSLAPAGAPLSLGVLEERLRHTHALSLLEKLTMKSEIAGLMASLRLAHAGGTPEIDDLRNPYDALLTRISDRVGRDPQLASDISVSREAIWEVLSDRVRFAGGGKVLQPKGELTTDTGPATP